MASGPIRSNRSRCVTADLFWQLVKEFGLPVAFLSVAVLAFYRRWLVTRGELQDKQDELDKMTLLFERERIDRIAAQEAITKFAPANAEVAQAVAALSESVIKRLPDPYDERIEGRRRATR